MYIPSPLTYAEPSLLNYHNHDLNPSSDLSPMLALNVKPLLQPQRVFIELWSGQSVLSKTIQNSTKDFKRKQRNKNT